MSYWPLYSRRDKEIKTESKALNRGKASLWLLTGKMVKSFLRDEFSIWGYSKFIPAGWKINTVILNRFSLNSNCLVKICPAYRIESVQWRYHIGLFIHQETKKQGQNNCYDKGKAFTSPVGWKDSKLFCEWLIVKLLLAGETLNSFQLDGIVSEFSLVTKYANYTYFCN